MAAIITAGDTGVLEEARIPTGFCLVDAEIDLRCPICDVSLPTMRAVRTHLQSDRHSIADKQKLTEYVQLARNRSKDRRYEGGLAKNVSSVEEKKAVAVDLEITDKTLNMRFGENANKQMVVTKVSSKSCLSNKRAVLVGARLISLGGKDVESRDKLNAAFRQFGATRPLTLRVLVVDGGGEQGFLTENAMLRKREERERVNGGGGDGEVNFYDVLGLESDAGLDKISDAYR